MQRVPPFKTLDVFRGFAALWVVMRHSCDRWIGDGHAEYLGHPLYAFSMRGQIGVTLFFVISGYCITSAAYSALISGKSTSRYAYDRIRRIYPPYLATLLLAVLSITCINFANSHRLISEVHHLSHLPLDAKYWIGNLLLLQAELKVPTVDIVFWSLGYEIAFYFIAGVFLVGAKLVAARISLDAGKLFLAASMGISTAAALCWSLLVKAEIFPFDLWPQFAIGGLVFFLIEFRATGPVESTRQFRSLSLANAVVAASLTLLYMVTIATQATGVGNPSSRIRCMTTLLFAAVLMALRKWDESLARNPILHPLMWVGAFSYGLYLTHNIVIPYVDILSRRAGLNGSYYWVAFCLQIAVAIVFGRLFYLLVEKRFISTRQIQRLAMEHVA